MAIKSLAEDKAHRIKMDTKKKIRQQQAKKKRADAARRKKN